MKAIHTIWIFVFVFILTSAIDANTKKQNSNSLNLHRPFVSSSLFMLANFFPDSPHYFQINYGYPITQQDILIFEAITWQYPAPLGIPYSSKQLGKASAKFPGVVRDIGIGIAYQRFWWKKMFTVVHATPFFQQYLDTQKEVIQSGFQLFLVARMGYHFKIWNHKHFFIEPSVACTYWPINTNMPSSFQEKENQWPNYFLFEPGFNVGYSF